jgi:hypothetical protein
MRLADIVERTMSYCEHCEGQRFDRSRVLRALRRVRKQMRMEGRAECAGALGLALEAVKALDIPHLELLDDADEIIH